MIRLRHDDTGWSLDQLRNVTAYTVSDSTVLTRPMRLLDADVRVDGSIASEGATLAIPALGDWRSATLPWRLRGTSVAVADTAFTVGGAHYSAGTFLVRNTSDARDAVRALGLAATALPASPAVRSHVVTAPRIAFVTAGSRRRTKGGCGTRSRRWAFNSPTSPRSGSPTAVCSTGSTSCSFRTSAAR
jgi:hypothetical protein